MAYNGSGTFLRLYDWTDERDLGNNIDSTKMDAEDDGFATGLSNAITKDGQTTITANLPMSGYRHTGVDDASARTDYASAADVQDGTLTVLGSVSGTDTITASASPNIAAYAAGQVFRFVAAGANTGAVTININSVGAKDVTKAGTNALVAGDIPANSIVTVVYDGTRFQLLPVPNISAAAATVLDDASVAAMRTTLAAAGTGVANTFAENQTFSKTAILAKGADVASATALTLGDGNAFDVTGTTTITSIATKGIGTHVTLQFDAALTLTHHATDLILPTGANITTAAGDIAVFYEYASGDWRCISYTTATGKALKGFGLTLGTEQVSTSGTAITFPSIPSGTTQIVVMLEGVSTSSTDEWILQIGDSGGLEDSSYSGASAEHTASANAFHANSAFSGFTLLGNNPNAAQTFDVVATLTLKDSANNTWAISGTGSRNDAGSTHSFSGHKSLSGELTQLAITTEDGSDTFDAGSINISYL